MKILLLGEYSNVHATLALGLKKLGHEVTVVSNGDFWKNYPRDIDVSRKKGKRGGICLLFKIFSFLPRFRGYDVVQLINPMFFELKAGWMFHFYRYLRTHNRCVVLGAYGMDWYWVHTCMNEKPLRYSDFNMGDNLRDNPEAIKERRDWLGTTKERLNRYIAESCDGIVAGLYEYWVCYHPKFPQKTQFIPFPIVPVEHPEPREYDGKIHLFIGINRERNAYKGTDIMLRAAQDVVAKHSDRLCLTKVESVPFSQYQELMEGSDVILDQLYSYTPSMNPLQAMAKGIVCMGGGEEENYQILGEEELRPIINVEPTYESVYTELEKLALYPQRLSLLKQQSIAYIQRHHDYIKVAAKYEIFYGLLLSRKV